MQSDAKQKSDIYLKKNYSPAVTLSFVVILSFLCINLFGIIVSVFLKTMLAYSGKNMSGELISAALSIAAAALMSIFWLNPLELSIKSWYQRLSVNNLRIRSAFKCFSAHRRYFSALYFTLICGLCKFAAAFFVFLFPSVLSAAIGKAIERDGFVSGIGGALLAFSIILSIIGAVFVIRMLIKLFFADYLFIRGVTASPVKAMRLSFALADLYGGALYRTIASLIPYFLSFLLVLPIPFVIPKIKIICALFANDCINEYQKSSKENAPWQDLKMQNA